MATYSEILKDPRWQKKRLETLEAAGWECENCGTREETLHVHHKRYFKGRKPWEYEPEYLGVLCENCHANHHHTEELLKEILSIVPNELALGLLAGFFGPQWGLNPGLVEEARQTDALSFAAGFVGSLIGWDIEQMRRVAEFVVSTTEETSEARQLFKHNQEIFGKDS